MAKLDAIREVMKKYDLNALIVPSSDPHQSEYPASHWKDREYISGFTGSAGLCVITNDNAGLWTDSRYFLSAAEELKDSGIALHKLLNQFAPEHLDWLKDQLKSGEKVAIHGQDISINQYRHHKKYLDQHQILLETEYDIVSEVWVDRPPLSDSKILVHEIEFSGKSSKEKIDELRAQMKEQGMTDYLICALDDIAWLFNIRGSDVVYNPVVVCFALIGMDSAKLFVNKDKVDQQTFIHDNGITIFGYDELSDHLNGLQKSNVVGLDPNDCNFTIYNAIPCEKKEMESLVRHMKSIKNNVELKGIRNAMLKDGVALANAFYRLENTLKTDTISEAAFADIIKEERSKQEYYFGESFGAIVGYRGNGAIVHYAPRHGKCSIIQNDGILLCDCGGQYKDGTTDITRTISLGAKPSAEIKKHFTLVLKGHIALNLCKFPKGTTGAQIDILARQFLWQNGLNYFHGTGHGVGAFLNVHEGPHGLAGVNTERGRTPLKPGMILSNEPGFYLENQYGIRIENIIAVEETKEVQDFYSFEVLTWYPIDFDLIDETMLDSKEKAWLNKYQFECYNKISSYLSEEVKTWFRFECRGFN
jgi:Xaa-Pro aminopeptidase